MKKKKYKIILVVIIIIILVICIFFALKRNGINVPGFSEKEKTDTFCQDISKLQKNKNNFIVYVGKPDEDTKDNATMNKIKEEYKNLNIVEIESGKKNTPCVQDMLKKANLDKNVTNQDFDYIVLYKNGEYTGLYSGIDNYYRTMKYVSNKGLVEDIKIDESITFEQFNTKIKDRYLLFIVCNEKHTQAIKSYVSKYFVGIDHNIVDVSLPEGSKIYKNAIKEYKIDNVVPQAIYFKNSQKLISIDITDNESEYIQLQKEIEKYN